MPIKPRSLAALALMALAAACADGPAGSDHGRATRDAALTGARADVVQDAPQLGGEPTVIRFRSIEDADFPPQRELCNEAGFVSNVFLGASLWSEANAASSGRVVNNSIRRIGRATACAQITNPSFPPGLPQLFYARFDTPEGSFTASGACTLISNDVPQAGLVLAGCHLRIIDGPADMRGGVITSTSVFNPRQLPGFNTGSEWTLQFYPS